MYVVVGNKLNPFKRKKENLCGFKLIFLYFQYRRYIEKKKKQKHHLLLINHLDLMLPRAIEKQMDRNDNDDGKPN